MEKYQKQSSQYHAYIRLSSICGTLALIRQASSAGPQMAVYGLLEACPDAHILRGAQSLSMTGPTQGKIRPKRFLIFFGGGVPWWSSLRLLLQPSEWPVEQSWPSPTHGAAAGRLESCFLFRALRGRPECSFRGCCWSGPAWSFGPGPIWFLFNYRSLVYELSKWQSTKLDIAMMLLRKAVCGINMNNAGLILSLSPISSCLSTRQLLYILLRATSNGKIEGKTRSSCQIKFSFNVFLFPSWKTCKIQPVNQITKPKWPITHLRWSRPKKAHLSNVLWKWLKPLRKKSWIPWQVC